MSAAWWRGKPPRCNSSSASSKLAVSEAPGVQIGNSFDGSLQWSAESSASLAFIQFRFPMTVLISPLWATNRYGWASGQDGKVFVEKREWTSPSALSISGLDKSVKNEDS